MRAELVMGIGIAMVAFAMTALGQGQIMTDPTRPPFGSAAEGPEEGGGSQLQTVVIAPDRNAAIINGVMVKIGDKYGDAVLERVAEDRVVLRSGTSRQELRLHPAVDKVSLARAEPAAQSAPGEAKPKAQAKAQAKSKAKPKTQAKPKTAVQQGAQPASDSSAGTR